MVLDGINAHKDDESEKRRRIGSDKIGTKRAGVTEGLGYGWQWEK